MPALSILKRSRCQLPGDSAWTKPCVMQLFGMKCFEMSKGDTEFFFAKLESAIFLSSELSCLNLSSNKIARSWNECKKIRWHNKIEIYE